MRATINVKVNIPTGISGDWRVEKFEVPKFSIESLRLALHGRPVQPGHDKEDITRLKRKYCRRCHWQGVWAEKDHQRIPRVHKQLMGQFYRNTGIDKAMKNYRKEMGAA